MKRISASRTSRSPGPVPRAAAAARSAASASARGRARRAQSRPARGTRRDPLGPLDVGIADGERARASRGRPRRRVGVLGEELAVDVGRLAHEDGVVSLGTSGSSTGRRRGKRAAAPPRRSRTSGSASSVQATPTSSSSSDSSAAGSRPGASSASIRSHVSTSAAIGPAVSKLAASGQQPSSGTSREWACGRRRRSHSRDPDRAGRVGAERRVGEPGGDGGRRAAARGRPPGPGRAGSARRRSAGSRTSSRRRTRAGSSCRRSRSRPPRAAAPPTPSRAERARRRSPSRTSSPARPCRTGLSPRAGSPGGDSGFREDRHGTSAAKRPSGSARSESLLRISSMRQTVSVEGEVEERDADGAGEGTKTPRAQPRIRFLRSSSG